MRINDDDFNFLNNFNTSLMKTNYYSFLLMMLSTLLFAQNNDFNNGSGDLLWSNPANWTLGEVPNLTNTAAVRLPLLVESNIDTNVSIRKIQNLFGAAGNISVGGTGMMTIDGGAANANVVENVTANNHQLNFKGNVTINNAAGFSRIRNQNGTQNTIRFDAGSTLTLTTALELFTGSNNAGYLFNGALAGPANFRLAAGVTATFGATSNNTNFSGEFVFLANSNLIVNTADNGLFYSGLKLQVNGSGGTVTINGANVLQSGISVGGTNVFNAVFNKNQSAMTNIVFGGGGVLNLTIGTDVNNLSFANNSANIWSSGTLNIINFEDGVIRFGTDNTGLTSSQLAQINAPAAGEPLDLDSNGFLVKQSSLATFATVAQQSSVCSGQSATFILTGLIPDSTSSVTYTIGGGSPLTVNNIVSDANGDASFTINLGLASNGQTLTITEVVRTDEPSFPFTPSENNTVVLEVTEAPVWFADVDGDGFGDDADTLLACEQPVGYVAIGGDCDDNDGDVYPGATEICYDGILQNCDGSLTDGCAIILAELRTENCGATLTSITQTLRGDKLSAAVPSGVSRTGYRFRVTNLSTTEVREVTTSNYVFNLGFTDIAQYNTTYSIEVAVRLNQEWMPYGPVCFVTTPGLPTTQLTTTGSLASCGSTVASMNSIIRANVVTAAIAYEYEVSLIEDNVAVATQTLERPGASFNLLQFQGILPLKFASEYKVRVRVLLPTSAGDEWSEYGAVCSVFTPLATESFIEGCDAETGLSPAALSTVIASRPSGSITEYRFRLVNEALNYDQTFISSSRFFRLSNFNALSPLQAGATYTATVEYQIYGFFYGGKDCLITVPGGARMANPTTEVPEVSDVFHGFKALASPNPFEDGFTINVYTNSTEPVGIAIYDMTGRLLETREVSVDVLSGQLFGERYPSGVYNIVVTQDEEMKTVRVIKK
jgi:hypothetical protein